MKRNPTKGLNPEKMMEIYLVAQVLEGVKDAEEGRMITTEELLTRVEKWGK